MLSMCLLRIGQDHVEMKRVIIATLRLLRNPLCKEIKTNTSKDMIVKQRLSFTSECAGQKVSEYFCSQNTFSHQFPFPV